MSKLEEIISGWSNVIFTDTKVEEEALRRAKICSTCENNINNVCNICRCPLIAKTRSPKSECPIKLW